MMVRRGLLLHFALFCLSYVAKCKVPNGGGYEHAHSRFVQSKINVLTWLTNVYVGKTYYLFKEEPKKSASDNDEAETKKSRKYTHPKRPNILKSIWITVKKEKKKQPLRHVPKEKIADSSSHPLECREYFLKPTYDPVDLNNQWLQTDNWQIDNEKAVIEYKGKDSCRESNHPFPFGWLDNRLLLPNCAHTNVVEYK
ncbi:hypothetical protein PCYB_072990 [Plasmodium cynomolgi strain B]|uniref:Secreted protein n=1 Tax=Plasmodium cynomolgi (strain B) TaxID=1120755 RepID=K6V9E6_PLACD|nr:hypothetical protein PCYB_072990 [Plasmodium cynomolgi strain B]GAB65797.1 hypothetical protein PCYB_072990 [Plasmodium cynomolgi strain B]